AYNDGEAVRLRGKLDACVLERSLNIVVERHEILRTLFPIAGGKPVQLVQDQWTLRISTIDLTGRPPHEQEAEVERLVSDEPARPYDLGAEPGIRATLVRLGADDHVFILMLHHIVCDGWSLGILYRELGAIYGALIHERPHRLPRPELQYGDFAAWQHHKVA